MKTIIAGGRTCHDVDLLREALASIDWQITEVVCGCAPGVDTMGAEWAQQEGLPVTRFPADWKKYGKAAGPRRNVEMSLYADALVALWDYASRGTKHMIETARKEGLRVYVHRIDKQ